MSRHLRSLHNQLVTMQTVLLLFWGVLTVLPTLVSGQVTLAPTPAMLPPGRNRWFAGPYGSCSSTCEGTQTRDVYCRRVTSDNRQFRVDDSFCEADDPRFKPITSRSCGIECPTYSWATTVWTDCSAVCGDGTQTRTVRCRKETRTSDTTQNDEECIAEGIGIKPVTERSCRGVCAYQTGSWQDCSVTCGGGTRTRTVRCIQTASDGSTKTVGLSNCAADGSLVRPADSEECNTNVCGEYGWITGEYGECSDPCGGVRTRDVQCMLIFDDGSLERANESECVSGDKPSATTPCAQHIPEDDALYDQLRDAVCPDACCIGGSCKVAPRPCRFTYPGKDCACPITTYAGTCQQEVIASAAHVDQRIACTCQQADEGGRYLDKVDVEPLPTLPTN